jgi:HTH-type transcriptional regulator/antitoxin HigA
MMANWKVIKTVADYDIALAAIDKLLALSEPSAEQLDELELISVLVENYEEEHYPIGLPDPIEAIKFRMEQDGLTKKDLQKYIGSASKVSEVLNRKKPLSLTMMRALHEGLGIPAEVLMQESGKNLPPYVHAVEEYPFNEMFKRNYFVAFFTGTIYDAREQAEELLNSFFDGFEPGEQIYCKKTGTAIDVKALAAWHCQIKHKLAGKSMPEYRREKLTDGFMNSLARLSYYEQGPLLAKELLNKFGIHVVIERHLPGTHLDGASFLFEDGHPVIALTLRHDRIDNFWFTLLHELAHIKLHLTVASRAFFDDIDGQTISSLSECEIEANKLAENALIPKTIWDRVKPKLIKAKTNSTLENFAFEQLVSLAVVAGRVRWETQSFSRFSDCLGHVKYLFSK